LRECADKARGRTVQFWYKYCRDLRHSVILHFFAETVRPQPDRVAWLAGLVAKAWRRLAGTL